MLLRFIASIWDGPISGVASLPAFSSILSGLLGAKSGGPDDAGDAAAGRQMRVVPYVIDTKNALVYAVRARAICRGNSVLAGGIQRGNSKQFQLEPRELSCEAMPSLQARQEIVFYEASEGGAGVLRQLVEDPKVIPLLARSALEICHFDPGTLVDRGLKPAVRPVMNAFLIMATSRIIKFLTAISLRRFS